MTSRTGMGIILCRDMASSTNGHFMWQSTWKSCVSSDSSATEPALGLPVVLTGQPEVVAKLSATSSFLLICSGQTAKLLLWCLPLTSVIWSRLQAHPPDCHHQTLPKTCVFIVHRCSKIQACPFICALPSDYRFMFWLTNTVLPY